MHKKNNLFVRSFFLASLVFFSACGGGGSGASSVAEDESQQEAVAPVKLSSSSSYTVNETLSDGVTIVDASVVGGLRYVCDGDEGLSSSAGVMECEELPISLYLGNLKLGNISKLHKDHVVYTTELLAQPRGATLYPEVTKVSMLLQSLDEDGDISNGITISAKEIEVTNQYFYDDTKLSELSLEEFSDTLKEIVQKIQEANPNSAVTFVDVQDAQDSLTAKIAEPLEK